MARAALHRVPLMLPSLSGFVVHNIIYIIIIIATALKSRFNNIIIITIIVFNGNGIIIIAIIMCIHKEADLTFT